MSGELAVGVAFLNAAGAVVLDLTAAGGYDLVSIEAGGRTWRRSVVTADDVESEVVQSEVLEAVRQQVVTLVTGATHAQLETRKLALINAAEQAAGARLRITLEGVVTTFRMTGRSDSSFTWDRHYLYGKRRIASLSVPTDPRPL